MVIMFILLIIIFFIPIPIKIKFIYENKTPKLFIYKFNIKFKKFLNKKMLNLTAKKQKSKANIKIKNVKNILNKIKRSNFKPGLRLKVQMEYGFSDAAITGLCYGLMNIICPIVYELFNVIFKIKKFEYDFNPNFNNTTVKLQANSIIFISLVNVMYMVFIIFNNIKKPLKKRM